MQKRIVVLGGGGFIGTHLCLRLLEEGHEVFCVDIRDAVNSPLLRGVLQHPLFRYVHHNIINGFSIRCDEIYNLASPSRVRYNKALPVETLRVSVLGAINTLETARSEHARVVFASAGNIYGIGIRQASRVTSVRHTTSSTKASAPPKRCTGHTTVNTTSTHALPAYSTPTAAAPTRWISAW